MVENDPFAVVVQRALPGASLQSRWPLKGGVSAHLDALECALPGGDTRRVVVRRHGANEWKSLADNVTTTEFALLKVLHSAELPVPQPLFVDVSATALPSPYFVMEFVEGTTAVGANELGDALRQMADFLCRLHNLDLGSLELPTLPAQEDPVLGALEHLPQTPDMQPLRDVLSNVTAKPTPDALLHGDFWPENILWKDEKLAAVLDWEDASIGTPLADLAGCRVELLCHYDEDAMQAFTDHYLSSTSIDTSDLALWELYGSAAALAGMANWGLPPEVEAHRRERTAWFLERVAHEILTKFA